jgi:hypothetical protein
MNTQSLVPCGMPVCHMLASNGVIIGTQCFCVVPAQNDMPDPLPLVRYNLCAKHLDDVRCNFKEVLHDESSKDFRDITKVLI